MKKMIKSLILVSSFTCASLLTACPSNDGPLEKAGEAIDNAAEDVKDAVDPKGPLEKAGEAVDDAGKKVKEGAEDAGDAVKDAVD